MYGDLWKSSEAEGQGAHRRPKGRPCEGVESQPADSPPMTRLWRRAGGFSSPFAGEGCQLAGCARGHPSPCQLTPYHHHHHPNTTTTTTTHTKKLDTF